MIKTIYSIAFILSMVLLVACNTDKSTIASGEHDHEAIAVTQWNGVTEIFMEYPALVVGHDAKFLIHLTDMKDFKAVIEGKLKIDFINKKGDKFSLTEDKPKRDGIYTPVINFKKPGTYTMTMTLLGNQVNDVITVENVEVYAKHGDLPHGQHAATGGNEISFLKEQQWKIDFETVEANERKMNASVNAVGEIKPKPEYFAKVVSPVTGMVLNSNNKQIKFVGDVIKKGEVLVNISPSADAGMSFQKIKNEYQLALSEFNRVKVLYKKNAVSQKRYEEAELLYKEKESVYNSLKSQIKFIDNDYSIVAPISGRIEKVNFNLGEQIESGKELFTIINPQRLILQANVPSARFESANSTTDADFILEGYKEIFNVTELNGRKISTASALDESNRTIPVYFEFVNPKNIIKVGMYADVSLKIGEKKNYLSIPHNAIINEDGMHTVYVQLDGESFEKRIVKTGIVDNGFIQILDGIKTGERVVTTGAYQVRLAALSPESAIGAGHVH